MAEPESTKVVFPYESLEQAAKDKYKKIGGPEQAFRFLQKGYKSVLWRKRADANTKTVELEQDAAFAEENGPVKKRKKSVEREVKNVSGVYQAHLRRDRNGV